MAKEARSNPLMLEELETDDAFMKKGIQLIVSTSDPERVYELMAAEIDGLRVRHQTATKFFSDMAGFSPTFGILGTVIGLISVLGQLSSPGKLGPAIAAAFTATLWGVLLANAVWLPMSNKLRRLSDEEISYREMVVEGLLTMQLNASTTELKDRLDAFLPPSERDQAPTGRPSRRGAGCGCVSTDDPHPRAADRSGTPGAAGATIRNTKRGTTSAGSSRTRT